MYILVDELLQKIPYSKSTFLKILTDHGISNSFELSFEDLLCIYNNLRVVNSKGMLFRSALEDIFDKFEVDYVRRVVKL